MIDGIGYVRYNVLKQGVTSFLATVISSSSTTYHEILPILSLSSKKRGCGYTSSSCRTNISQQYYNYQVHHRCSSISPSPSSSSSSSSNGSFSSSSISSTIDSNHDDNNHSNNNHIDRHHQPLKNSNPNQLIEIITSFFTNHHNSEENKFKSSTLSINKIKKVIIITISLIFCCLNKSSS